MTCECSGDVERAANQSGDSSQSPHLGVEADSTPCILEHGGLSSTERTVREILSVMDIDPLRHPRIGV